MSTADSLSRLITPLLALGVVGVLILLLRWAHSARRQSLVERTPRTGSADDYGLLVAVSSPGSVIEAELQRRRLQDSGIQATLVITADGPRIMVFREHERTARALLAG